MSSPRQPVLRARPNLLTLGFEHAAQEIAHVLSKRRGASYCYVTESGDIHVPPTHETRGSWISDEFLIGTYTRHTPIEVIENDLLERQRELFLAMTERNRAILARSQSRSAA